ncbi:MAG TPA: hypothetical protein VLA74_09285 [Nitrososphaeraceae archaeon]|nr:hypothetical protein [Nitrososphaeraceae archaeon]
MDKKSRVNANILLSSLLYFLFFLSVSVDSEEQNVLNATNPTILTYNNENINFTDNLYNLHLQYPINWTKIYPYECPDPEGCTIDTGVPERDNLIVSFDIFNDSKKKIEDLEIYGDIIHQNKNLKDTLDSYSNNYIKRYLEPLKYKNHIITTLNKSNTIISDNLYWEIVFYDNYKNSLITNKHMLTIKNIDKDYWFGFKIKYSSSDSTEFYKYLPSFQEMIESIKFTKEKR